MSEAKSFELDSTLYPSSEVVGIDLRCPLSGMAHDLPDNIIQTQTYSGRTGQLTTNSAIPSASGQTDCRQ